MASYDYQSRRMHPLVEVADVTIDGTPGQTARWSDVALSMSDATYYDPRLLSLSPLRYELGRLLESQFVAPDLTVVLDNTDDAMRELLDENRGFAGLVVTVLIGNGVTKSNYETVFTGRVRHPDGWSWSDTTVQLSLDNAIEADTQTLPKDKIWPSSYPNAHSSALYRPIPEVLGDWSSTAGGGEQVPCYCVDTTAGTGGQWLIGEHCDSIERVLLNGVSVSFTTDSLEPAKVTINVATTPGTDVVTANVIGRTSSLSGRDTAVEWAYDLLTQSWAMAVPLAQVDTAEFTAVAASFFSSQDAGRRWIGAETASSTLLGELCIDGFFDLVIAQDGQYKPVFRYGSLTGDTFREVDLATTQSGERLFSVSGDPERAYVNQLPYDYRLEASETDSYAAGDLKEDSAEKTAVGRTVRRRLRLRWLYKADGADGRAEREMLAFATDVEMVQMTLTPRGLALEPGDPFLLAYSKYEMSGALGTPMMARSVEPNYQSMQVAVTAWSMAAINPKRYQADGSAAWASATAYAQAYYGFYQHDASQVYF
jgi:hypothetical protein